MFTGRHSQVDPNVANVGNFNAVDGLNVNNWNRDNGNDNVFASPLVVSRKKVLTGSVLLGGSNPSAKHPAHFLKYCLKL